MDAHPGGLVLSDDGMESRLVRIEPGERIYKASDVKLRRFDAPIVVVRKEKL